MIRVAILACLFPAPLFALSIPPPDLSIVVSSVNYVVPTGERFPISVRVVNETAVDAQSVRVTFGFTITPPRLVSLTPPSGWICEDTLHTGRFVCMTQTFPGHAEATFAAIFISPTSLREDQMRAGAFVSSSLPDARSGDNYRNLDLPLRPASTEADLAVKVALEKNPIPPGERANVTIEVRNSGPAEATKVALDASF